MTTSAPGTLSPSTAALFVSNGPEADPAVETTAVVELAAAKRQRALGPRPEAVQRDPEAWAHPEYPRPEVAFLGLQAQSAGSVSQLTERDT